MMIFWSYTHLSSLRALLRDPLRSSPAQAGEESDHDEEDVHDDQKGDQNDEGDDHDVEEDNDNDV